ncbi:MAG: hypothetical protein IJO26_00680 [Clostridium sp.]|nr:hypothetical protein [Clostridium sp.]
MIKKVLATILCGLSMVSLVSCASAGNNNDEAIVEEANNNSKSTEKSEIIAEGKWAEDFTKEEVMQINEEITSRIEEVINYYGLDYEKEEKIKEENDESVTDRYIYTDNLNPEPNRMESMYYGFKTYGTDMATGTLNLKIGFKLDLDQIKNEGKFDFNETSIANFSKAMTNVSDRDYSDINKKIIDIVQNNNANGTIETNLDGLVETITIKDDYLLYRIDSKKYNFKI